MRPLKLTQLLCLLLQHTCSEPDANGPRVCCSEVAIEASGHSSPVTARIMMKAQGTSNLKAQAQADSEWFKFQVGSTGVASEACHRQ